jgi:hypothetical protein
MASEILSVQPAATPKRIAQPTARAPTAGEQMRRALDAPVDRGDTVEISTEAGREGVKTQVRNAVLAELRLLVRFPASDDRAERRADATP